MINFIYLITRKKIDGNIIFTTPTILWKKLYSETVPTFLRLIPPMELPLASMEPHKPPWNPYEPPWSPMEPPKTPEFLLGADKNKKWPIWRKKNERNIITSLFLLILVYYYFSPLLFKLLLCPCAIHIKHMATPPPKKWKIKLIHFRTEIGLWESGWEQKGGEFQHTELHYDFGDQGWTPQF